MFLQVIAGAVAAYGLYEWSKEPKVQVHKGTTPTGVPVSTVVAVHPDVSKAQANPSKYISPAGYTKPVIPLATSVGGTTKLAPILITPTGASSVSIASNQDIQNALNALNMVSPPLVADGVIGSATSAAIRAFQTANGLTVDGSTGPMTKAALSKAIANMIAPNSAIGNSPDVQSATIQSTTSDNPIVSNRDIQHALNVLGATPPLDEDGNIGPKSLAAIKAFQISHGLNADGIAGPKTKAALQLALHNPIGPPSLMNGESYDPYQRAMKALRTREDNNYHPDRKHYWDPMVPDPPNFINESELGMRFSEAKQKMMRDDGSSVPFGCDTDFGIGTVIPSTYHPSSVVDDTDFGNIPFAQGAIPYHSSSILPNLLFPTSGIRPGIPAPPTGRMINGVLVPATGPIIPNQSNLNRFPYRTYPGQIPGQYPGYPNPNWRHHRHWNPQDGQAQNQQAAQDQQLQNLGNSAPVVPANQTVDPSVVAAVAANAPDPSQASAVPDTSNVLSSVVDNTNYSLNQDDSQADDTSGGIDATSGASADILNAGAEFGYSSGKTGDFRHMLGTFGASGSGSGHKHHRKHHQSQEGGGGGGGNSDSDDDYGFEFGVAIPAPPTGRSTTSYPYQGPQGPGYGNQQQGYSQQNQGYSSQSGQHGRRRHRSNQNQNQYQNPYQQNQQNQPLVQPTGAVAAQQAMYGQAPSQSPSYDDGDGIF